MATASLMKEESSIASLRVWLTSRWSATRSKCLSFGGRWFSSAPSTAAAFSGVEGGTDGDLLLPPRFAFAQATPPRLQNRTSRLTGLPMKKARRLKGGGLGCCSIQPMMILARRLLKLTACSSCMLSKVFAIIAMSMLIISTACARWDVAS